MPIETNWGPPDISGSINQFVGTVGGAIDSYRLNQALANMPTTADGSPDYRAMALRLLGTNPVAAQQLLKVEENRQLQDYRNRHLSIQERQLELASDKSARVIEGDNIIDFGPRGERKAIYDRDTGALKWKQGMPEPGTQAPAAPSAAIPAGAIEHLKNNPALAGEFEKKYGLQPGAAKQYIDGTVAAPAAQATPAVQPTGRAALPPQVQALPRAGRDEYTKQLGKEFAQRPQEKILELDAQSETARGTMAQLEKIIQLSQKAYQGVGAGLIGKYGSEIGLKGSRETVELEKRVQRMAVMSLKEMFGGSGITDSERKAWVDLQGAASDPRGVREGLYREALETLKRRIEYNQALANDLRNGTFLVPRVYEGVPQIVVGPSGGR